MPKKYTAWLLHNEPMYDARVVQPAGSKFFEVFFRGRPVGRFKTEEAANTHMWKLIEKVQRARRWR